MSGYCLARAGRHPHYRCDRVRRRWRRGLAPAPQSLREQAVSRHRGRPPFFWLGDTAWELFHRLTREDAERYLREPRRAAVHGHPGGRARGIRRARRVRTPTANGRCGTTIRRSRTSAYFAHVDWVVAKANALGLYVGFLPTWGDKWNKKWGDGPEIFTPENAERYGAWLGRRYKDAGLVWILGGDRPVESDAHRAIIRGDGARPARRRRRRAPDHVPPDRRPGLGRRGSTTTPGSISTCARTATARSSPAATTRRAPTTTARRSSRSSTASRSTRTIRSPSTPKDFGHSIAARRAPAALLGSVQRRVRAHLRPPLRLADVDARAHARSTTRCCRGPRPSTSPARAQMQHARALLESRPFLTRIPDRRVIVPDRVPTSVPGAGRYRFVATRDDAGTYAMVYAPVGRHVPRPDERDRRWRR